MATNDVVLGAALRSNLLSLQNTQRNIDVTQLRLATGKKVNSALDNPQSFFQAQSLNNRASDLSRLLDGIGQSIRTIEAADKGITALTRLVEQASSVAEEAQAEILAASGFAQIKSTANLAGVADLIAGSNGALVAGDDIVVTITRANGAVLGSGDINIAAGDTIYDIAGTINSIAALNPFVRASVDSSGRLTITSLEEGATVRVSDGTASPGADGYAYLGLSNIVRTEETVAATRQGGTAVAGRTLFSQQAVATTAGTFEASQTLGTVAGVGAGFLDNAGADSVQVILNIDGTSTTVSAALLDTNTIQDLIDDINNSAPGIAGQVEASFNTTTGRIEMKFADNVGYVDLQFQANAASTVDFGFSGSRNVTQAAAVPTDVVLGAAGNDISETFTFTGSSAELLQFQTDFNKIRSQIDGIVEDANYRGVNLLGGDNLTTFFNEDRSNRLVTEGKDFTAVGLGIDVANFTNAASVQLSIDQVRNALNDVRAFGSSIANDLSIIQTRRNFTEQTINTLKAGASDLTDADLNEEGAKLLALQTAQQLGVTSLSLASQSQQSVLRLF